MKNIICIVGNPNCGKTTLFNALTGSKQEVGNWPGVTVDKKTGRYTFEGNDVEIVDLPGIYSITPASTSGEDERIARDYILTDEAQAVINIVDASNLERNLYLTAQLIEMRVPMVVAVNMLDIAKNHKIEVDLKALQQALGCPVVGLVAAREQGVRELQKTVAEFLKNPQLPPMNVSFEDRIEKAREAITQGLRKEGVERPEWFALQLVEGAPGIEDKLPAEAYAKVKKIVDDVNAAYDGDADIVVADARYNFVNRITQKALIRHGEMSNTMTDKIDRVVLNRWLGLPIFLAIMYVMFLFTQNLGGAFIDFFDITFAGIFVDGFGRLLEAVGTPEWLKVLACRRYRRRYYDGFDLYSADLLPVPVPRHA